MAKRSIIFLIVPVAIAAFIAGTRFSREPVHGSSSSRRILYYYDPMHPSYRADKPGIAPDCGMELEPMYSDGPGAGQSMAAGGIDVSDGAQRQIGLHIGEVSRSAASTTFRVPGRVSLDETRIFRVAGAVDGWIRNSSATAPGNIVQKGQVLATYYNRDLLTAQQTYLYALNTVDRLASEKESAEQLKLTRAQMRAARENLEFLGMGEAQIDEIGRTREIAREIALPSPVQGVILVRNAFTGLRFERGSELFRLGDISRVWVFADVFERDAWVIPEVKTAAVRYRGRTFSARVGDALPQFDAASRVLKVRLELDNPGLVLRPDMFVDVEFRVALSPSILLPADAVLDSGLHQIVFVDRGSGRFEPRPVRTGVRVDDRVQILEGLTPGERVALSSSFLLDSESRMRQAQQAPEIRDPVCGMRVDPGRAAATAQFQGVTYHFCSKQCKETFDRTHAAASLPRSPAGS